MDAADYLAPGRFIDSDTPAVVALAHRVAGTGIDPVERAVRLFTHVRDTIRYDPFDISAEPGPYRASAVAAAPASWCVPKAVLLAALARASGIPARLGFADVRNHLQTPKLRERMGGADLFLWHGYTDLHLDGRWVKATPAFNAALCERFGVAPIAFDGRSDALLHEYAGGREYMRYVRDRGTFADLPLDRILATFRAEYGPGILAGRDEDRTGDAFDGP